jgi:phosphoribosyl 1,2-cyclic phosphodiesterase
MKIEILGCDGGYAKSFDTTSALIDNDLLLDAGTGVGKLSHRQMNRIKNVLLTHCHLDHVASICFLVDHSLESLHEATKIHCLPHTARMIRENLINGKLWPEIEEVRINGVNLFEIHEIKPYMKFEINGKWFTPLSVDHVVPTVSYALHGPKGTFVYVSDMIGAPDRTWNWINRQTDIKYVVMECSFPSGLEEIARLSKHMTPELLWQNLQRLNPKGPSPKVYASHIKPFYNNVILKELAKRFPDGMVTPLKAGMKFTI